MALVPNVEVVTLLIALCAYCWGIGVALPAVNAFILCDCLIYGVGTWVISYVIHWNTVAVIFGLIGRRNDGKVNVFGVTAVAVMLTIIFGVTTSAVDTAIGYVPHRGFYGYWENFLQRFVVMYVAGVWFYVTQVVCNAVLFAVVFRPLVKVNVKAKTRLFGN